jgi:hypothetical protein
MTNYFPMANVNVRDKQRVHFWWEMPTMEPDLPLEYAWGLIVGSKSEIKTLALIKDGDSSTIAKLEFDPDKKTILYKDHILPSSDPYFCVQIRKSEHVFHFGFVPLTQWDKHLKTKAPPIDIYTLQLTLFSSWNPPMYRSDVNFDSMSITPIAHCDIRHRLIHQQQHLALKLASFSVAPVQPKTDIKE